MSDADCDMCGEAIHLCLDKGTCPSFDPRVLEWTRRLRITREEWNARAEKAEALVTKLHRIAREYHLAVVERHVVVVEKLEAEIRRLQADLATVRAAHGCKGRCLK